MANLGDQIVQGQSTGRSVGVDPDGRLWERYGTKKYFLSPDQYAQYGVPVPATVKPQGNGPGKIHGAETWNRNSGKWESHLAGGKLLNTAVVAGLTAGVADVTHGFGLLRGAPKPGANVTGAVTTGGPDVASTSVNPSWWSSVGRLIPTAVAGATQIYGARTMANANRDASQLEYDATMRALEDAKEDRDYTRKTAEEQRAYDRQQYADYRNRMQPYERAGSAATDRLSSVLAQHLPNTVPGMGNGSLVRVKAPNGQVKDVPAYHADWYVQQGATRV